MPLPPYDSLKANFPAKTPEEVKTLIGGKVNLAWISNVCVIRVSRALNYSGDPIPIARAALNTVSGADGRRYAFRVREFRQYLQDKYGPPDYSGGGGAPSKEAQAMRGIILFDVQGWSDASGHADLWNGSTCEYKCYWGEASGVEIWQAY